MAPAGDWSRFTRNLDPPCRWVLVKTWCNILFPGRRPGLDDGVLIRNNSESCASCVRPFVVIGAQRTGTNLLREILNTNEQLAMLGEILTPNPAPAHWENFCRSLPPGSIPPANYNAAESLLDEYFAFVEQRIRNHWEGNRKNNVHAFGVDIKYNQLTAIAPADWDSRAHYPFFLRYLRSRGALLIHTTRNAIHCAISALIASERNLWHNYEGALIDRAYRIDVEGCLSYARTIIYSRNLFEGAARGCKVVMCPYEGLVKDLKRRGLQSDIPEGPGPLQDIAEAIGAPFRFRDDGRLHKAINVPYSTLLSNYETLIKRVLNSEFSALVSTLD